MPASAPPPPSIPGYTAAAARGRRGVFFGLVGITVVGGVWLLGISLGGDGFQGVEWVMMGVFGPLFYQLALGFWTALVGLGLGARGRKDAWDLSDALRAEEQVGDLGAATAILMPIYNEDVSRVFAGLRVMYTSLERTGQLERFAFFILSDSDTLNHWIEEEVAWLGLCRELGGRGRIFYRRRRQAIHGKSGNVADFCRRWGKGYRYMLVMDADSVMEGELMVRMVRLMEKYGGIGIVQAAPRVFGAGTRYGRVMQFAQAAYGGAFMAGLNYVALGDATFWGHNAIIRLGPFMEFCGLPELPGREPLGGHILSHDFVESALMTKAGYQVWLLPVLEGSYEEGPPTLIDALKRDRRWCQGNMQHVWLLFAKGWAPLARLNFFHGILSYVASPLWLIFLLCATAEAGRRGEGPPGVGEPAGLWLLGLTLGLLFVPKGLLVVREVARRDGGGGFHSRGAFLRSCALDTLFFALLAPVLMLFHSKFVACAVLGRGVKWASQRRVGGGAVDWGESVATFAGVSALGLAWGAWAFWVSPSFLGWISPVLVGISLAIPFSIFTAGEGGGRRGGLWATREERDPPGVLRQLREHLARAPVREASGPPLGQHEGLVQAVLDPLVNALHVSLLRTRPGLTAESREYLESLRLRLLREGPDGLHRRELSAVLYDPDTVLGLHYDLWSSAGGGMAPWWEAALRQYNRAIRASAAARQGAQGEERAPRRACARGGCRGGAG